MNIYKIISTASALLFFLFIYIYKTQVIDASDLAENIPKQLDNIVKACYFWVTGTCAIIGVTVAVNKFGMDLDADVKKDIHLLQRDFKITRERPKKSDHAPYGDYYKAIFMYRLENHTDHPMGIFEVRARPAESEQYLQVSIRAPEAPHEHMETWALTGSKFPYPSWIESKGKRDICIEFYNSYTDPEKAAKAIYSYINTIEFILSYSQSHESYTKPIVFHKRNLSFIEEKVKVHT
jgi:hypothetical protein